MNVASSSSLSFNDKIGTNNNSVHDRNQSTPGRILVRVKRRRSRSPPEALLLTDNVTPIKRAKIGVSDKCKSMIKDDKLPVKIFRFTATISDDVSKRNTEELITKMLEKTNKDIERAKAQNVLNTTSEKKSLKDLTPHSNSHQLKIFEQNLLISSIKKSAEARYKVVQTRRNNIKTSVEKSTKNEDQPPDIENAFSIRQSRIDHKNSDLIDIGLSSLYQLYDIEIEESKMESGSKFHTSFKAKTKNANDRIQDDIITCNGIQSEEVLREENKTKPVDDFVYDLYCDIHQENLPMSESITKSFNICNEKETESLPSKEKDKKLVTVNHLPDLQSSFGHATNIVGCDWKSVQDYLTCDLNEEMPEWWHRGGVIEAEYGSDCDNSDDSNAEDNWRNEYPDELDDEDDGIGYDEDAFGFDDGDVFGMYEENDIYGFNALQINNDERSSSPSDDDEEQLLYSLAEDSEYNETSNKHGAAYAKYKRKIQHSLEVDNHDDND